MLAEAATLGATFALVVAAAVALVGAAIKAFERNLGAALAYLSVCILAAVAAVDKL
jgi:hypothetical protein